MCCTASSQNNSFENNKIKQNRKSFRRSSPWVAIYQPMCVCFVKLNKMELTARQQPFTQFYDFHKGASCSCSHPRTQCATKTKIITYSFIEFIAFFCHLFSLRVLRQISIFSCAFCFAFVLLLLCRLCAFVFGASCPCTILHKCFNFIFHRRHRIIFFLCVCFHSLARFHCLPSTHCDDEKWWQWQCYCSHHLHK